MPFELSVPPDSPPVTSRPYLVNPLVIKQMDSILDEYLAAGLIQHSTYAVREPCGHHTKEIRRDSAHHQLQKVQ